MYSTLICYDKQRRLQNVVHSLSDSTGHRIEGKEAIAEHMVNFYKDMLGSQSQNTYRIPSTDEMCKAGYVLSVKPADRIVQRGCNK